MFKILLMLLFSIPAYATLTYPHGHSFAAAQHSSACSWAGPKTMGGFTSDATCAFVETINRDFPTLVTVASADTGTLPNISWTPRVASSSYYISAKVNWQAASGLSEIRLVDANGVVIGTNTRETSGSQEISASVVGLYRVASTGATILTIQGYAGGATINVLGTSAQSAIEWTVIELR